MKRTLPTLINFLWIFMGSAIYALGFSLFLAPNQIGAGGLSGVAVIVHHFFPKISVGVLALIMNIPLFIAGYRFVGRKFFWGSLIGMTVSSVLIDVFTVMLPTVEVEPLLAAIYGGGIVGVGCGIVLMRGASTGGYDIVARLLQYRFQEVSMGKLILALDVVTALATGLVFWDLNKTLYCIAALFVCSEALDGVLYRFDYSHVAIIITDQSIAIRDAIDEKLGRGCTFLKGEGAYTGQQKDVIYCAIKRRQAAELKALVMEIDPGAFLVLQEAHQVLGEGFDRYGKAEK